jgi:Lipocalin-like domain
MWLRRAPLAVTRLTQGYEWPFRGSPLPVNVVPRALGKDAVHMEELATHSGENPLLGTWKLISFVQVLDSGEQFNVYGEHPGGYIGYAADGRMYAIVTSDPRVRPRNEHQAEADQINLYQTMFAYAGTYVIEGDKVTHRVDISWNQSFTGTTQVRFYQLDGRRLTVTTAPTKFTIDGRDGHLVAVWEKVRAPTQ